MQWISAVRMIKATLDGAARALDDKALIELILAGRNECFDVLMERHLRVIRKRVESIIPNKAEAEDVLQGAQLKSWTHLSSFRNDSSFRTWISRIAINEALQFHRRTKREREWDEMDFDRLAASTDSPERLYARQEMAGAVRRAIRQLPAKFQQIVVQCELQELGVKETARELEVNPQMVKTRLFRARRMLSKVLQSSRTTAIRDRRARFAA
jgi:RNA polymerase sigma-70 factor (ECF subfamily)